MGAIFYAVLACLCWGCTGFLGGLKTKTIHILYVLAASYLTGFIMISIVVGLHQQKFPMDSRMLFGVLAGIIAPIGVGCLLRGMAIGKMGIISAIAASGVCIPVIFDLLVGAYPTAIQFAGMTLSISGVIIISVEKENHKTHSRLTAGAGLAIFAACLFGFFYLTIDAASNIDPFWTTFCLRLSALVCIIFAIAVKQPKLEIHPRDIPALAFIGIFETSGTLFYAIASTKGLVSVVTVITSLNPVVVAMLALTFLKERLNQKQIIGIATALTGILLIVHG